MRRPSSLNPSADLDPSMVTANIGNIRREIDELDDPRFCIGLGNDSLPQASQRMVANSTQIMKVRAWRGMNPRRRSCRPRIKSGAAGRPDFAVSRVTTLPRIRSGVRLRYARRLNTKKAGP